MPARTFSPVSIAGILPLAALYVSAGAEFGAMQSPAELLTPGVVAALAALAAAPFAAKALAKARTAGSRAKGLFRQREGARAQ